MPNDHAPFGVVVLRWTLLNTSQRYLRHGFQREMAIKKELAAYAGAREET